MSSTQTSRSSSEPFDYIIVGGGTAGLTLASRLKKRLRSSWKQDSASGETLSSTPAILVIEAGGDPSNENAHKDYGNVRQFATMHNLRASPVTSWTLSCDNGAALNSRVTDAAAGKGLGGSALINAGMWMRGPQTDWDLWARVVKDDDWNYTNMVEFFRLSEDVLNQERSGAQPSGYLKVRPTAATGKKFPLREAIVAMWREAGVEYISDMNAGQQNGACDCIDVWEEGGQRQLPGNFLDLDEVEIWTGVTVTKVTLTQQQQVWTTTGVQLEDGRCITAAKEVFLCAGAYQSPKLLQLSGIGHERLLAEHGLEVKINNGDVGSNLADHVILTLTWQLREPEKGLALGSPKCTQPFWLEGLPQDVVQYDHLPTDDGKLASLVQSDAERDYVLRPDTSHIQNWIIYCPMPAVLVGTDVPADGRYISSFTCLVTPTSRGRVQITSGDALTPPKIEKNFQDTAADRFMLQNAVRRMSSVFLDTEAGRAIVEREIPPDGFAPINSKTPDADIEHRIRNFAWSISHPMGTCAMGKVVDSHCRVIGVRGLRVVDASIIPQPPAATIQAPVYAVAERVADFVARGE